MEGVEWRLVGLSGWENEPSLSWSFLAATFSTSILEPDLKRKKVVKCFLFFFNFIFTKFVTINVSCC